MTRQKTKQNRRSGQLAGVCLCEASAGLARVAGVLLSHLSIAPLGPVWTQPRVCAQWEFSGGSACALCKISGEPVDDLKSVRREGESRPRPRPLPGKSYCCSDILAEIVKLMRYTPSDIKSRGLILSSRAFPITLDTLVGGSLRSTAHSFDYSLPARVSFSAVPHCPHWVSLAFMLKKKVLFTFC